jgi:hypothetical protein
VVSYFFYSSIYLPFTLCSQQYHFSLLCWNFIFVNHFPLSITTFVKCHMGLSLEDNQAAQLHALLSVCGLNDSCAMTCQWQTLKDEVYIWNEGLEEVFALYVMSQ